MKEQKRSILMFLAVLLFCGITNVIASPSQWTAASGGNDHWYEVIVFDSAISWTEAKTAAQSSSHLGVQGNLASITSAAENNYVGGLINAATNGWVYNGVNGFFGPWIGGYQPVGTYWAWIDGETWSYTAWETGQPTDQTGQDYVHYYVKLGSTGDPTLEPPTWNDYGDLSANDDGKVFGYVVEYGCANTIPAPSALLLLSTGLASLAGIRRRFGK